MKKINKKIIISIVFIILTITTLANSVYGVDPYEYQPQITQRYTLQGGSFLQMAGVILGWIKYIGILIAVVVLAIIGLKTMFCSVEEKSAYKKAMFPYIVGCAILVGITIMIEVIESIAIS